MDKRLFSTSIPLTGFSDAEISKMIQEGQEIAAACIAYEAESMRHAIFCDPEKMCQHWEEDIDEFDKEREATGL